MTRRIRASRGKVRRLAARALVSLPAEVRRRLDNIVVVVEELPTGADYAAARCSPRVPLFGIYRGWPLTIRGKGYHLAAPDHIALFRRPLLAHCRTERELTSEVRHTLLHEVGHHFGLDDDVLAQLEERAQ